MTNEQWSALTHDLKLPRVARKPIEDEIDRYRSSAEFDKFAKAHARNKPQPSQSKKKLERAASLAAKLLDILDSFDKEWAAYDALVDPAVSEACLADANKWPEGPWGDSIISPPLECPEGRRPDEYAMSLLCEHRAHLAALCDRFRNAAAKFPVVSKWPVLRKKAGRDPSAARELINRVSKIVRAHTGRPLSKGKPQLNFACTLGDFVNPRIGPGSIKEAIENLEREPRLASKKILKPG